MTKPSTMYLLDKSKIKNNQQSLLKIRDNGDVLTMTAHYTSDFLFPKKLNEIKQMMKRVT